MQEKWILAGYNHSFARKHLHVFAICNAQIHGMEMYTAAIVCSKIGTELLYV